MSEPPYNTYFPLLVLVSVFETLALQVRMLIVFDGLQVKCTVSSRMVSAWCCAFCSYLRSVFCILRIDFWVYLLTASHHIANRKTASRIPFSLAGYDCDLESYLQANVVHCLIDKVCQRQT